MIDQAVPVREEQDRAMMKERENFTPFVRWAHAQYTLIQIRRPVGDNFLSEAAA